MSRLSRALGQSPGLTLRTWEETLCPRRVQTCQGPAAFSVTVLTVQDSLWLRARRFRGLAGTFAASGELL